jgi:hypothetical protein
MCSSIFPIAVVLIDEYIGLKALLESFSCQGISFIRNALSQKHLGPK